MAKAPLIQSLEDNAHKQNAPPTWRPLHTVGTIRVDANGNAIARIKAKYTRFEVAQYGTPTAAKEAAHMHIEKVNMENLIHSCWSTKKPCLCYPLAHGACAMNVCTITARANLVAGCISNSFYIRTSISRVIKTGID